jgi:hypothetical protein
MVKPEYPPDVSRAGESVQKLYLECLANGCTPKLAEMLALQQAPKSQTDVELFRGKGTLADQFRGDEMGLNMRVAVAKRHGYKPNRHDWYNPALADFAGDPKGFVSPTAGRGHMRKVSEQAHEAIRRAADRPRKQKLLADDIVKRKVAEMVKENPALKLKDQRELREAVIEKHGSKPKGD